MSYMPVKVIIKATLTDERGDAMAFIRMSDVTCAEKVFDGLTHDPWNQTLNWFLIIEGDLTMWHCPLNTTGLVAHGGQGN